jgi:hypothetical protein
VHWRSAAELAGSLPPLRPASSLRSARTADLLILGLIVAIVTVVYARYALRVATFQLDENLYIHEARLVATHFPSALWQSGIFQRGLQRLDPILLAIPFAFMRGPGAYEVDRVIQCLLFTSTAVPAFLLARGARLKRFSCHLAALLAIVVPWAVVSTSFLSECAAYPAYAWSLYAVWLTIARPSRRHEALAVLAIVLAALSRTAMLALAPMLPLAVLWQEWRWDLAGTGLRRRLLALPGRLWRRHTIVSVVSALGIAMYLAGRLGLAPTEFNTLTGEYGVPHIGAILPLLERYRYYLSRATAGTGLIAIAVGLPWAVRMLVRPRDGASHALAVVSVLGVLCVLLSLIPAGPDERYIAYAAIPFALVFAAALGVRPGIGVLAGAVVVDLLIESVTWPALANAYDYFTYPAAIFYQRALLGHISEIPLALVAISPERRLQIAVLVVALAWMLAARHARTARTAVVLLGVGVLALGAIQTVYALHKYATGPGAGPDAAERSWVDRHVPAGAEVSVLPVSLGLTLNYTPIWETAEFWNTSIGSTAVFDANQGRAPLFLGGALLLLTVHSPSGLISAIQTDLHVQEQVRYVLVPKVTVLNVGLDVEQSSTDPALLLELERLKQPARVAWMLNGTSEEGFMAPGRPAEAVVYSDALEQGDRCATVTLTAPPGFKGSWPYAIADSGRTLNRGALIAGSSRTVTVRMLPEALPEGPLARLSIHVDGSVPFPILGTVSARVEDFALHPCTGRV